VESVWNEFIANNIAVAAPNIGEILFLRFVNNSGNSTNKFSGLDDVTLTVSPIPEPSAALLGGLGLLALLRRRRS
jgi:MYXO-CTERM domain-containing protein